MAKYYIVSEMDLIKLKGLAILVGHNILSKEGAKEISTSLAEQESICKSRPYKGKLKTLE